MTYFVRTKTEDMRPVEVAADVAGTTPCHAKNSVNFICGIIMDTVIVSIIIFIYCFISFVLSLKKQNTAENVGSRIVQINFWYSKAIPI